MQHGIWLSAFILVIGIPGDSYAQRQHAVSTAASLSR
jgi:hypothetical protein